MTKTRRTLVVPTLIAAVMLAGGCVKRTITITSDPGGALVWLNDREIGRTPVDVEFVHYGTYDVRLRLDGYEPLLTTGKANPPLWDVVGPDFVAELLPLELHSEIHWHYELEPRNDDPEALLERAREMRQEAAETGDSGSP